MLKRGQEQSPNPLNLQAPRAGLLDRLEQAHLGCMEALAISSSFFLLLQLLSILSLLSASVFEIGPSQYKGAGWPCCRILFSKSVVIPT